MPFGALAKDGGRRSEGCERAHQILTGALPVRMQLSQIVAVVVPAAEQVTDFVRQRLAAFRSGPFLTAKPGGQQADVRDDDAVAADLWV